MGLSASVVSSYSSKVRPVILSSTVAVVVPVVALAQRRPSPASSTAEAQDVGNCTLQRLLGCGRERKILVMHNEGLLFVDPLLLIYLLIQLTMTLFALPPLALAL
jgi:hypothetical protein